MWIHLLLILFYIQRSSAEYSEPSFQPKPLTNTESDALQWTCGKPPRSRSARSINPEFVNRTRAPWAVSILRAGLWKPEWTVEEQYSHSKRICSATLISDRHVLTAAHCLMEKNILRLMVVVDHHCGDKNDYCKSDGPMFVRRIIRGYKSVRYGDKPAGSPDEHGDLGIYELSERIPFSQDVWPACVADFYPEINDHLDFFGFGRHNSKAGLLAGQTDSLQYIPATVVSCKVDTPPAFIQRQLTIDRLCTTSKYQHPCAGDSGGGYISGNGNRASVVAVVSNGPACEHLLSTTVFGRDIFEDYNTETAPHVSWICEATGLCVSEKVKEDVEIWRNLPNRNRERYTVIAPLPADQAYLVKLKVA